jgi:hypothetical protein
MPNIDEALETMAADLDNTSERLRRLRADPETRMCFPDPEPEIEIEEEQ